MLNLIKVNSIVSSVVFQGKEEKHRGNARDKNDGNLGGFWSMFPHRLCEREIKSACLFVRGK